MIIIVMLIRMMKSNFNNDGDKSMLYNLKRSAKDAQQKQWC